MGTPFALQSIAQNMFFSDQQAIMECVGLTGGMP